MIALRNSRKILWLMEWSHLETLGIGLYWIGVIATLIVDFFSLSLLARQEGIGWAIAAFVFIPAQLFVPFYVGTWHLTLVAMIILPVGYALSRGQLAKQVSTYKSLNSYY